MAKDVYTYKEFGSVFFIPHNVHKNMYITFDQSNGYFIG